MADNNVIIPPLPGPAPVPTPTPVSPDIDKTMRTLRMLVALAQGLSKLTTQVEWDDELANKLAWAMDQPWLVELIANILSVFKGKKPPTQAEIVSLIQAAATKKV